MDEPDYTQLTLEWPLAAAKSFSLNPRFEGDGFNFVYISGEGADPSGQAKQLFARVKGKAETNLLQTADTTPGLSVYNLRPAGIDGSASKSKPDRARTAMELGLTWLYPVLRQVAPKWHTPVDSLAEVAVAIVQGDGKSISAGRGVEAGGWTLRNIAIRRLAGL